jgi:hypothetical protein
MPPKRKKFASPRFRLEQADTPFKTESRWHSRQPRRLNASCWP